MIRKDLVAFPEKTALAISRKAWDTKHYCLSSYSPPPYDFCRKQTHKLRCINTLCENQPRSKPTEGQIPRRPCGQVVQNQYRRKAQCEEKPDWTTSLHM
jgi:hypothetical protein